MPQTTFQDDNGFSSPNTTTAASTNHDATSPIMSMSSPTSSSTDTPVNNAPTETSPGSTSSSQHVAPNTHHIVTRSETGIFKPKLYNTYLTDIHIETDEVKEALSQPQGHDPMQVEYQALVQNNTYGLLFKIIGCKWVF
ncbi:hypothetical protein LR48_Vigan01g304900 [Vigna angularis]|uniref:Uncharacterized protein n=2 Tax=Phaseolus angularis TaxID=3914 RepID=A0A0L9TSE8_PHAAN|nr:hypothetical protein LR48_Vigan01g304900 [Vigna angularis]BAT77119.1 hypothetical protein VIGAN_01520900 [Vigna angularis var. angularis]